jgi:hypothetical protein
MKGKVAWLLVPVDGGVSELCLCYPALHKYNDEYTIQKIVYFEVEDND